MSSWNKTLAIDGRGLEQMRHRFIRLLLVAGVVLTAPSCDSILESRDHTYDGPPLVEFGPVLPAGTYTLPVSLAANSVEEVPVSVRVNYVGPSPKQNVTGTFTLASGTTATEGTHFTVSGGKSYTISAGTNSTDILITVHGGAVQNGETVTIVLELDPGQAFIVSENYKQFTISVSKGAG